jgi:uncharacterized membrane protein YfcA
LIVPNYAWLVLLGFGVGTYGTLIGAGGGFVLVPILLLLYPNEPAAVITGISLAVVFFNAASGTLAYAVLRRIDYLAAAVFAAASIPGAVLGALATTAVDRRLFDGLLGALMILAAGYLAFAPRAMPLEIPFGAADDRLAPSPPNRRRKQLSIGAAVSLAVGMVASFLGIGGGIVHVPLLVRVLRFPVHRATATSHMVLAVTTLVGTSVHVAHGGFHHGIRRTVALAIGVIIGAQIGARLSGRVRETWILHSLAAALALVGIRLLMSLF